VARATGTASKPKTPAAVLSPPHGPTLTIRRRTLPHSATSRCDRVIRSRPNYSSRSDSSAKDAINKPGDSARARRRIAVQQPVRRIKHPHHDLRHGRVSTSEPTAATPGGRQTTESTLEGSGGSHPGSPRSPHHGRFRRYRSVHLQPNQMNQPGDQRPAADSAQPSSQLRRSRRPGRQRLLPCTGSAVCWRWSARTMIRWRESFVSSTPQCPPSSSPGPAPD